MVERSFSKGKLEGELEAHDLMFHTPPHHARLIHGHPSQLGPNARPSLRRIMKYGPLHAKARRIYQSWRHGNRMLGPRSKGPSLRITHPDTRQMVEDYPPWGGTILSLGRGQDATGTGGSGRKDWDKGRRKQRTEVNRWATPGVWFKVSSVGNTPDLLNQTHIKGAGLPT